MLLAALLFLVAADLLIFVPYVLSDLMFWGLSTSVLTLGVALVTTEERRSRFDDADRGDGKRARGAGAAVSAGGAAAGRFLDAWRSRRGSARPLIDRFAPRAARRGGRSSPFVAIVAHAYVLMHPSAWPFGSLPGMLTMVARGIPAKACSSTTRARRCWWRRPPTCSGSSASRCRSCSSSSRPGCRITAPRTRC